MGRTEYSVLLFHISLINRYKEVFPVKRKIELFMTLLLLLGMIVVSRKLSQLVTSEKVDTEEKENQIVVIDAGHGGIKLRQN